MNRNQQKIAIVGAGVGGLAAAARLASRGCQVEVFEKMPRCGGRANLIEDRGFRFDTGPSFVLMPDFFEEIFTDCGGRLSDYLELRQLKTSYRIFFSDGDTLSISSDPAETRAAYERLEPGAGRAYDAYLADLGRMYGLVRPLLYQAFYPPQILQTKYWPLLFRLRAFRTYWQTARKYFRNEKICYSLTFQSMFIGVSPFSAPAFYSIITYADHHQKVFHPMGGMYQIPRALERLGREKGARFRYNIEVKGIKPQGGGVLIRAGGEEHRFDKVVVNADFPYARKELLGAGTGDYAYSCSAYLMYLGLSRKVRGLSHHALFLTGEVRKNLDDIFRRRRVSRSPSFYIHVPTETDPSLAPPGKEIVYVLVPVPHVKDGGFDMDEAEPYLKEFVFRKIRETCGEDIRPLIEVEHSFRPGDFISRYNLSHGSAFGLAHTLLQSAFLRPPNHDPACPHIYYVGASTQPGGGLPPVLASSAIVADMITPS